jgi:hypothetical protein
MPVYLNVRKDPSLNLERVPGHKLGDIDLITRIAHVLHAHYPDYYWQVLLNDEPDGGLVKILCGDINSSLMTQHVYGFVIKIKRLYGDPNLHTVVMAAGEILERARLRRGRNNGELPTHVDGVAPQHQPVKGITV